VSSTASETIRVLIVDDIAETRENLRKLLSFDPLIAVVGAAGSGAEGIALANELRPAVVLMDINMPDMDGITATELITNDQPAIGVVMLSVQGETDYLRRAMLAGARDYLIKPPSGDELMNTIHRVYEMGKARAAVIGSVPPAASAQADREGLRDGNSGRIVAVFSPKGGVGCTTLAVNLAIALQQMPDSDRKVVLADGNLQFGDVGVMLNLSPGRSIIDLLSQIEDMDRDMLNSVLTPHGSGIKVMLGPPRPEAAEAVVGGTSTDGLGGHSPLSLVLDELRNEFDIIVVDVGSQLDDVSLAVFDAATLIVLVVVPTIPSIKSARLFLDVARQLDYPSDKVVLVVNNVDRRAGIRVEQIERAMIPVFAQIPRDDPSVLSAVNRGAPIVLRDRSRPIAQSMFAFAERVNDVLAAEDGVGDGEEREVMAGSGWGRRS